jgi:hypothetical protein
VTEPRRGAGIKRGDEGHAFGEGEALTEGGITKKAAHVHPELDEDQDPGQIGQGAAVATMKAMRGLGAIGADGLGAVIVAISMRWLFSRRSVSKCRCASGGRRCEHSSSNVIGILLYRLRINDVAKPRSTLSVPRLDRCHLVQGEKRPFSGWKDYIVSCLAVLTPGIRPVLTVRIGWLIGNESHASRKVGKNQFPSPVIIIIAYHRLDESRQGAPHLEIAAVHDAVEKVQIIHAAEVLTMLGSKVIEDAFGTHLESRPYRVDVHGADERIVFE